MKNIWSLSSELHVHGLMFLSIILAASSFPIGAEITNELPPEIMMFLRFSFAAALFAPFIYYRYGLSLPSVKMFKRYIILSIPLAVFFWCMFESLRYTSVINTGALYTTVPAITSACALLINREVTGKIRSLGLFLGTVGALWIVFRGDVNAVIALQFNYGDLIFLTGCFFLGFYNPLVKKFYAGEPMEVMTFWILLCGSLWLFAASVNGISDIDWPGIEYTVFGGLLYLSLFSTLITFFLLNYSTVRLGATKVAAYGFLTPIFVILISIPTGIEKFEPIILPGLLIIVVSMFLIQRGQQTNTISVNKC